MGGMRVASVCSSVGGLDLGLHRAGHNTVFLCEVDPWRRTVLKRHWPGVPIHPDLKELRASDIPECDLFVGGTPCQDLSNAGKRAGLDGERSGLFWAFAQLRLDLYELHGCAWSLWENVAGALSSNDGRDFAAVLAAHVGADVAVPAGGWPGSGLVLGPWGTAEWRLLDAQFFGVPQRRRRVFVAGHLGAERPLEVLADTPRGPRHPAPSGGARPHAPGRPAAGPRGAGSLTAVEAGQGRRIGADEAAANHIVASSLTARYGKGPDSDASDGQIVVASALDTQQGSPDDNSAQAGHLVAHTLTAHGYDASEDGTGRGTPLVAGTLLGKRGKGGGGLDINEPIVTAFHATQTPTTLENPEVAPCLTSGERTAGTIAVAFSENQHGELVEHDIAHALSTGGGKPGQGYPAVRLEQRVRRLTPTECERLMGWPDDWTLNTGPTLLDEPQSWPTTDRSPVDPTPDGRRYSACGDGVVAHVAEWIGLGLAAAQVPA